MAKDATETGASSTNTYECTDCGERVAAAHQPSMCAACGGEMQNISLTRGQ